ncbi:MAG: MFS transporter [Chitinophagaceae bacterium]|nr:MAG: MFS transporter [Chitinophagaceae bacterium]
MQANESVFNRIGIPKPLAWGYLGVLIFMMGDGMEQGWLSPYLIEKGMTMQQTASLFTAYGVTIAISSWLSGVLVETYGPRRSMLMGLLLYVAGTVGFVGFGLKEMNNTIMLATYALRGFGYPLFAYSFLVWISYITPKNMLGRAVGWFWFVFTGGLNVLGAFYASWAIKNLGNINALWSSLFWVAIGALFALVFNKTTFTIKTGSGENKMKELWQPALKAWFPEGKEDPELTIIKVTPTKGEYWDTSSNVMIHLFGLAKALATGKSYEPGDNQKINVS